MVDFNDFVPLDEENNFDDFVPIPEKSKFDDFVPIEQPPTPALNIQPVDKEASQKAVSQFLAPSARESATHQFDISQFPYEHPVRKIMEQKITKKVMAGEPLTPLEKQTQGQLENVQLTAMEDISDPYTALEGGLVAGVGTGLSKLVPKFPLGIGKRAPTQIAESLIPEEKIIPQAAQALSNQAVPLAEKASLSSISPQPSKVEIPQGLKLGGIPESPMKPLPRLKDNYLKDLSEYTNELYRETDARGALELTPKSNVLADQKISRINFANTKDFALGQGKNKGILLRFDAKGIKGQVNRGKPGLDFAYEHGNAELLGKYNDQPTYQKALRSITLKPDLKTSKVEQIQLKNTLKRLEADGWIKTVNEQGLTYTKPSAIPLAQQTAQKTVTPQEELIELVKGMGERPEPNVIPPVTPGGKPFVGIAEADIEITKPVLDKVLQESTEPVPKYIASTINTEQLADVDNKVKSMMWQLSENFPEQLKTKVTISKEAQWAEAQRLYALPEKAEGMYYNKMLLEYPQLQGLPAEEQIYRLNLISQIQNKNVKDFGTHIIEFAHTKYEPGNPEATHKLLKQMVTLMRPAGGMASEFGRALNAQKHAEGTTIYQKGINKALKNVYKKIDKMSGSEVEDLMMRLKTLDVNDPEQAVRFIRAYIEPRFMDKAIEAYVSGLFGTRTLVVNTQGNLIMPLLEDTRTLGGAAIERGLWAVTGGKHVPQSYLGEVPYGMYGAMMSIPDALRGFLNTWRTEIPASRVMAAKGEVALYRLGVPAIKGFKGRAVRSFLRFATATDEMFKIAHHQRGAYGLAYRNANIAEATGELAKLGISKSEYMAQLKLNPTKEMAKQIEQMQLMRTFQKPQGPVGSLAVKIRDAINNKTDPVPAGTLVAPFMTTPVNIAEAGASWLPGVQAFRGVAKVLRGGKVAGPELSEDIAQGIIGMGIGYATYLGVKSGRITGGAPKDPVERKIWLQKYQPYSINVGTNEQPSWFQWGRAFEPLAMTVGFQTDIWQEVLKEGQVINPETVFGFSMTALGRNIFSKTWTMGVSGLLNSMLEYDRYGGNYLEQLFSSFIPFTTLMGDIARITQPDTARVGDMALPTLSFKKQPLTRPESVPEAMRKKIPGLNQDLLPVFDIWGQPVVPEGSVWYQFFSPIRKFTPKLDWATNEVVRLGLRFKLDNFGDPQDEIWYLDLNRDEYMEYVRKGGELAKERVDALEHNRNYQMLSDRAKAKVLGKVYGRAKKQMRGLIFKKAKARLTKKGLTEKDIQNIRLEEKTLRLPPTQQEDFLY